MLGTPLAKMEHEKFGLVGGLIKDPRRLLSTVPRTGLSSIFLCSPSLNQERAREVGFGQMALNRHSCGNVPFAVSRTLS